MRKRIIALGIAAAALGVGGVGVAMATDDDDATDTPITGSALGKASNAALEHVGSGSVTGTEVGDEESYYEVEVTRDDGSEVDVQLNRGFEVVGDEDEGSGGDDD